MTVSWTPPQSDGGTPIIGYFVERKSDTSSRWVRVNKDLVSDTMLTVTDLTEKSEYQFRVYAENKAGVGPASEPSDKHVAKPPYGKQVLCGVIVQSKIRLLILLSYHKREKNSFHNYAVMVMNLTDLN